MAFFNKIKKGIKHPLLKKIVILLIIVTLSYLIFRKYKLKEGMVSDNSLNIIQFVEGIGGTVIEIDNFIGGQKKNKSLMLWEGRVKKAAAIVDKNSSVIVIPPIIGQDLSNSAAFVNPLDSISDGISLIESKGGKFVDTNESCLPLKKKRIKYISKNLKINGKRPNICDSNLFKVLTVKSNLLPHPNNGLKQKNNTGGGDDDVDGNGP